MKNQEIKNIIFKYGELFCGPGGLALGAMQSEIESNGNKYKFAHAWANDYDLDSCKTYAKNICPENPKTIMCKDVRELDASSLSAIDAFAYGFPCNDFSIVGEQKGFKGKFGPLYAYGVAVLNQFKPKFFVAENVGGIKSANNGKAFEKILSDLENSGDGYAITPHLYRAEEYGVPQTRHRIIIVGIEKRFNLEFKPPAPTHKNKHITAKEALENPPIPESADNSENPKASPIVIERLKRIKPGQNAWTADLPDYLKLNVKSAKLSQIYKRLSPDRPSYTITGSGGGGTHGYHYAEPRPLTNRERARIQTFPDDFSFEGCQSSVRKQIGMAVPPLLSKTIFIAILKTFAGQKYACAKPNL